MTFVYITVGIVGGIVALVLGLQFFVMFRVRRQRGKPAPELAGKMGRRVSRGKSALFYFYSPSCGACRAMTPVMKRLAKAHEGGVYPVDIAKDLDIARKFGVMATPTTIYVDKGVIQEVFVGPQPATLFEDLL